MTPEPPSGQKPVDPSGAFSPPPPPNPASSGGWAPPPLPAGAMPPPRQPGPPPGGFPPPMMMPPMYYPKPPKERSFARAIFMTLATTVFSLSLLLNIYLIIFSGLLSGGGMSRHKTLLEGNPKEVIAVVPLSGIIDSGSYEQFDKLMRKIESDGNVKALVLEIESPGGTVTASDEIYNRLQMFKQEHKIPLVVSMRSVAASGGYYAACAADYIFAEPTTITGSIGVLLPKYNVSKLAEKWGIEDTSQHSTGADFKTAGSPLKPERSVESAYFQKIIDASFNQFKGVVSSGRSSRLTRNIDEIANGMIYLGPEAMKLGLVDQMGYPQDAWMYAKAQAHLAKPTVIRYDEPNSLLELLSSKSSAPGLSGRSGISGNTVNINFNVDVQRLLNGATLPMYLFRAGE